MISSEELRQTVENLETIRRQAQRMLSLARTDSLEYFQINEAKMPATVDYLLQVIQSQYPMLNIPYHSRWRHFEVGGIHRIQELMNRLGTVSPQDKGKILYELVIISVLLDAGAGKHWLYHELATDQIYSRSEGLAVASLALYQSGLLSLDPKDPFRVDADCLLSFSEEKLSQAFQVSDTNPLEGLQGRVALLNRLGRVIKNRPDYFAKEGRLGHFYTYILGLKVNGQLSVAKIFHAVLDAFAEIWPERQRYQGIPLGDVWIYPPLKTEGEPASELVPFHKLSQWLTYSLIEPLEDNGVEVCNLDQLTGLPEYRNGGLLIDMGLLQVKDEQILSRPLAPDSAAIVEWRALTVAVLDELAETIRQRLQMSAQELPLAKILQGGTWEAGRRIARQKRSDGVPPIQLISDGTVF
ncbi:hypothetical protein BN59_01873 [Legionella massiliensis]|uniref:Uncharacterized protein n=1 Tax=Legionella massiliensis TaxID=1034943 RepID=A0A078L0L3_9GAMM|nr:URC4/urg3 family protein [Legionella massiliensis]CDZ77589.1 hypothetical protein BN59_01873 [Legionella massiliensis]CEE13327.1 hypothetical protein BN1094_01873 [Legionella massiliensis]